jgi:hypothetical protein
MYPHRIRLRGPWESTQADGLKQRVDLPGGWRKFVESHASGVLSLQRRFGLPRTLDQDEVVFLNFRFAGAACLRLNGTLMEPDYSFDSTVRWKVTQFLQQRNLIELTVSPPLAIEPPEVALEICGPIYLQDVVATANGWTGRVVGENRPHLEVHLLAQGRVVSRIPVQTNDSFNVMRPNELPEGSYNRNAPGWTIELIELANRWFALDFPLSP